MKKLIFMPAILVFLTMNASSSQPSEDQRCEFLARNHIDQFLTLHSAWATSLGDHRYDHLFNGYSLAGVKRNLKLQERFLHLLAETEVNHLDVVNQIDYKILRSSIESMIFPAGDAPRV